MAKSTNDILFKFLGDTKSLDRATKGASRSMADTKRSSINLTKAMGTLGLAFGAREILQFGTDSITAATDYEESVNAVKVASGEAAADILKIGDAAAESFGISKTELNNAAVVFSGFQDSLEGDPAAVFEDYLGRATDFASVFNIDVKDALDKFKSGLAGQTEPLSAFGLNLSAAAVQAHAVETGIVAIGQKMTNDEKVRARYSLLMKETAKFQGDFANTAEEAANKSKILNAKLEDLKVTIGQQLLPVYEDLLGMTLDLVPAVQGAAGIIPTLTSNIGALAEGMALATDPAETLADKAKGLGGVFVDLMANANPVVLGFRGARGLIRTFMDADEAVSDLSTSQLDAKRSLGGIKDEVNTLPYEKLRLWGSSMGTVADNAAAAAKALDATAAASRRIIAARLENLELDRVFGAGAGFGANQKPRAAGGPVSAGQSYLVGEKGPEVVVPGSSGTVIPNNKLGGGGGNVYITVNALDPDAAAVAVHDALVAYDDRYGPA